MDGDSARAVVMMAACLFILLLAVPFEPRFTLPAGPLHISLLEALAAPCFVVMALGSWRRGRPSLRARPLLALALMVAVAFLSAGLSDDPGRAARFALRLFAMSAFAVLVTGLDDARWRWGFRALAIAGFGAALLAILEGRGVRSLDLLLGVFRETPFTVAGVRRASAGSEYPNLGAGMIVYALLSGVTLLRSRLQVRAAVVVVLTAGLAFTYSRGAWVAGLTGLLVVSWFEKGRRSLVPCGLYLGVLGLFVAREEISQIRFGGENANDFYAATYEGPRQFAMDSSARIVVPVTVRNIGRRPWRRADEIHLSYHLYQNADRPLVDGPRTNLPRDVLPGESVTIDAILRAPRSPGEYLVMWDLVHEDTTWFSGQGVKPGVARLIVGTAPRSGPTPSPALEASMETAALRATSASLAWRPSRPDLWRLALRMWAGHPFLGVGPDNYRWTYGTLAGKPAFDTRVFSNNMFLEFAATLGTLGLAAFCAVLVFTFMNGWDAAARSDSALIALSILIAMTVHGLADYVLAFTGHYLVFGLVVGVLSRSAGGPGRRGGISVGSRT